MLYVASRVYIAWHVLIPKMGKVLNIISYVGRIIGYRMTYILIEIVYKMLNLYLEYRKYRKWRVVR